MEECPGPLLTPPTHPSRLRPLRLGSYRGRTGIFGKKDAKPSVKHASGGLEGSFPRLVNRSLTAAIAHQAAEKQAIFAFRAQATTSALMWGLARH